MFKEISKDLEATGASSSWASTDRDGNYWWMWNIRGWRDNWNGRACRSIRNEVYYVKIMKIYCLLNKEIKGRISRRKKKFKNVRPQIFTLTVSVKFYLICLISFEKVWNWKKREFYLKETNVVQQIAERFQSSGERSVELFFNQFYSLMFVIIWICLKCHVIMRNGRV